MVLKAAIGVPLRILSLPARKLLKTITVPTDLATISTRDAAAEIEPETVGMTRDGVEAIWQGVERYYRTGVHPAISICIRRQGEIIMKRAIGHACGNGPDDSPQDEKILIKPDTPIAQFSASKAVTAMLIHYLVEKGEIHLTDPVSHYIPEFAAKGKRDITIYHVLSHRSGFPSIPDKVDPTVVFDHDEAVRMLCNTAPVHPPGHKPSYHAITGGYILHEIVKRVTGQDLREFLAETIQRPLGFRYFNYGVPTSEIKNVAKNYATGPPVIFPLTLIIQHALGTSWQDVIDVSNDPRFLQTIIPSGNLVATADEMSQFFQLLLNGGELNGVRIFDPLTIRRATLEAGKIQFDSSMIFLPMRYSTGMMLGSYPVGLFGFFAQNAFGHWGFINSFSWADPDRNIAASVLNTGKPFLSPHLISHFWLQALISKYCPKTNTT
ncbi:serine hydrolase domain-containing protein [candidate division CSSED10-310 bacterium]|uniref:Serine hydrolase domain-containing protein n=1 Tax=candidate division CSSED10-310 bacterium TaxID=2855610 RepID=A0ABV6YWK2_UNCC1